MSSDCFVAHSEVGMPCDLNSLFNFFTFKTLDSNFFLKSHLNIQDIVQHSTAVMMACRSDPNLQPTTMTI